MRRDRRHRARPEDAWRRRQGESRRHENFEALRTGFANLERHIANVKKFGVPAVVSVNRFSTDTKAEHDLVKTALRRARRRGGDRRSLGARQRRLRGAGQAVLKTLETKPAELQDPLSRRHAAAGQESAPSPPKFTARPASPPRPASRRGSKNSKPPASAICRSASPRRSTASPPTPTPRARRAATRFRSARFGSRPARSSSSRSAARS